MEVEKSLSSTATQGHGDSGTSSRLFATLLTWMSDRVTPGFIVFTSNNHLILPPELTRKGRIDEAFWVDLPSNKEREDIWNVVINKYKRKIKDFDIDKLVENTKDYTGAEIEEIFKNALFRAFSKDEEISDQHLEMETKKFIPNCRMFPEKINKMRKEAKGKLRFASEEEGEEEESSISVLETAIK